MKNKFLSLRCLKSDQINFEMKYTFLNRRCRKQNKSFALGLHQMAAAFKTKHRGIKTPQCSLPKIWTKSIYSEISTSFLLKSIGCFLIKITGSQEDTVWEHLNQLPDQIRVSWIDFTLHILMEYVDEIKLYPMVIKFYTASLWNKRF